MGDLTLLPGSTLNVDLTSPFADTFIVRGNILLQGDAVLWIHSASGSTNDQFIVSNSFNHHRTITTLDSSRIQLEHIEFRTQEGNLTSAVSVYMNYDANDKSLLYVDRCWLDPQKAWLLFNMKNQAALIANETSKVPTEIYIQDAVQVSLQGPNTDVGVWLNFESTIDTLTLPSDQTTPFTWHIGRGSGGLKTPWILEADTVQSVGFGVQIFPSTQLTINGTGFPATGELKVALMFANNTDTISNLNVGLQNITVTNGIHGRVTLNNVNLGPIAWQLYALMNENLYIKNSIVNEIGIAGPSIVIVDSCLLQLAVLAAVGIGGSTMIINNSEIWNQEITAFNNSDIFINNCSVTGSAFSANDTSSHIVVNGGCFYPNPPGCTQSTMVNISTGQPLCNPFIPPGYPQNLTPSTVIFSGVNYSCVTGIPVAESTTDAMAFPNPFSDQLTFTLSGQHQTTIILSNFFGQEVLRQPMTNSLTLNTKQLSDGIYFYQFREGERIIAHGKVIKN